MGNKAYTLRFKKVNYDIFKSIISGKKKVETRAATVRYKSVKAGDTLILICGKEKIRKKVKKANIFKSIEQLLKRYNIQDIHPGVKTKEELQDIYYSFPGYREKIKKYGIIAIKL